MSFSGINRACEAILKKHESSYLASAITPAERRRFEAQGLLGRRRVVRVAAEHIVSAAVPDSRRARVEAVAGMVADGVKLSAACRLAGISVQEYGEGSKPEIGNADYE